MATTKRVLYVGEQAQELDLAQCGKVGEQPGSMEGLLDLRV